VGPTLHGMACAQVAVRRDGLPIRRGAENRNTKSIQLRTADRGWSYSLGFGGGANNSSPPKPNMLRSEQQSLGFMYIFWNYVMNRKWLCYLACKDPVEVRIT